MNVNWKGNQSTRTWMRPQGRTQQSLDPHAGKRRSGHILFERPRPVFPPDGLAKRRGAWPDMVVAADSPIRRLHCCVERQVEVGLPPQRLTSQTAHAIWSQHASTTDNMLKLCMLPSMISILLFHVPQDTLSDFTQRYRVNASYCIVVVTSKLPRNTCVSIRLGRPGW